MPKGIKCINSVPSTSVVVWNGNIHGNISYNTCTACDTSSCYQLYYNFIIGMSIWLIQSEEYSQIYSFQEWYPNQKPLIHSQKESISKRFSLWINKIYARIMKLWYSRVCNTWYFRYILCGILYIKVAINSVEIYRLLY